ncbi:MAG: C25 family cysteine peptidase [Crocinitomicaceae bacterium]
MKGYRLILFLLFFNSFSFAQSYGNEWIDYTQQYLTFPISKTGVYRINYDLLNDAGVPLSSILTSDFQLFGRDREQPIHIEDGGDGTFDSGDYFLFFAEKNDGWIDSSLYNNPNEIGNPYYSLFNDTVHYFFSWNQSSSNLRFQVQSDNDYTNYTPLNYVLQKKYASYNNYYNEGSGRTSIASSSFYEGGEGFGLSPVNGASNYSLSINVTTPSIYTGSDAPLPYFSAISTTNSNANYSGLGNHHVQWTIGPSAHVLYDETFVGYELAKVETTFPLNNLVSGTTPLKWNIIGDQGAITDYQSLNFWSVVYPRIPTFSNANNADFQIENNGETKLRLDLNSINLNNPIVFVFGDIPQKVDLSSFNGGYSGLIQPHSLGLTQDVVIRNSSTITAVSDIQWINNNGYFTDYTQANLEDALLMVYHPSLLNSSLSYKSYRESIAGGGHNVVLANIEELYYQYGGGVKKHINGVRRFALDIYSKANQKPKALFLMGKGITVSGFNQYPISQAGVRKNPTSYAQCLIPTFGTPSSDVAITSDFQNGDFVPKIPTARISVKSDSLMTLYLNKIIQYEQNQNQQSVYSSTDKLWQKQLIHFAGGSDSYDQNLFQSFLNDMEAMIEDTLFGGNVERVYKSTSNPFDPSHLSNITNLINNGVSIMNFFGHATLSGFDINIDNPNDWSNYGKYPLVIGNSCYNGNMYVNNSNVATELFVNAKDKGAIGFIGSSADGLDLALGQYSKKLYEQISSKSYGDYLSRQIQYAIEDIYNTGSTSVIYETGMFQMNLNGDPLIRINYHDKPEIEITEDKVWFTPSTYDLTIDSITINVELTNLGKAITDTFFLEIRRDFPLSSNDSIYLIPIPNLLYKDTIVFNMPLQPNIGVGINNFKVSADIPSLITEQYDESINNQVNKVLFVNLNGIVPVIPYDFAVVPSDTITVKASTIDPIASFNTYRFEIDTTDAFNSPELRYKTVSGLGGVKEVRYNEWILSANNQTTPLILSDSTVYYWRVSVDSSVYNWLQFSFQYIKDKEGWGQDHFSQYKSNKLFSISLDETNRKKVFNLATPDTLSVIVQPNAFGTHAYFINGQQIDYAFCGWPNPGFNVVVIDPLSHENWGTRYVPTNSNLNNNFGNYNDNGTCRSRSEGYFSFLQNSATSLQAMENMLLNEVPDSSYVLIYTNMLGRFNTMNNLYPNIFTTFASFGSDSIVPTQSDASFLMFFKKGDPNSFIEKVGLTPSEVLELDVPLKNTEFIGLEEAPLIGPSSFWDKMYWKQDPLELNSTDSTRLKIALYDINRSFQSQIDTVYTSKDSIINLNNMIDAQQYPYMKLSAFCSDSITFTPAQIDYWHVLYTPLPEAAIDGSEQYTWLPTKDSLNEGDTVFFAVDVKNIFKYDMDSLLISYWIEDKDRVKHPITYVRQDSLKVKETLRDTISFSTIGYGGINSLWMEVNPYINGSLVITDQPEQEHFNNLIQVPFFVKRDNQNPILDVTFDGIHILNNDIVSPTPEIVITLKDENPYLLMDSDADTSRFGIYIVNPDGQQVKIPFLDGDGNTVMQWIPANSDNKRFKIIYPSEFEKDGEYTLLVQGTDRSGNLSGDLSYEVKFEVVRESSITNMMNYPNPFTSSTRFVFTLTGEEVPDDILIQIMTVAGRVVKQIDESELGEIRIGRNITSYAWDGTDDFGDPLANGVYLYKVIVKSNGENMKRRESGSDKYFQKEFGKMYLMR